MTDPKPTRDGYEPEQMHGYERSELHSLREHLDTRVVDRLKELEKVAVYAKAYMLCAAEVGMGLRSVGEVRAAHNLLVLALDQAGFGIHT
jgi:hypothetical protein